MATAGKVIKCKGLLCFLASCSFFHSICLKICYASLKVACLRSVFGFSCVLFAADFTNFVRRGNYECDPETAF
jgi:hypothetical protein